MARKSQRKDVLGRPPIGVREMTCERKRRPGRPPRKSSTKRTCQRKFLLCSTLRANERTSFLNHPPRNALERVLRTRRKRGDRA
mmetsp:Transcript_20197/g.29317  ORF Transcript_20197/g.29317 Transcript_20197/m.29317 type:complete len:84 (-) Transcript_20197:220-471(-)